MAAFTRTALRISGRFSSAAFLEPMLAWSRFIFIATLTNRCSVSITAKNLMMLAASISPSSRSSESASLLLNSLASRIEQGLPTHGPLGGKVEASGLRSRPLFLCSFALALPFLLSFLQFLFGDSKNLPHYSVEFL